MTLYEYDGRPPRGVMARAPLPMPGLGRSVAYHPPVDTPVGPPDLLDVRGHSHLVLMTADGPRSYGALSSHTDEALRALDVRLDSLDAANEDADGLLPHQRKDAA
jgi:hypothetical protein